MLKTYYSDAYGVRQLDDSVIAAWQAAGNPKADAWKLIPDQPHPQATYDGTAWVLPPLVQIQTQRIAAINAECRARLIARFGPPEEQVSRAIGVYGQVERDALATGVAATIDAANVGQNAVLAATTIQQAEAVTVTWPAI